MSLPCDNDAECGSLECIDKICGGPTLDARVIDRNTTNNIVWPNNPIKPGDTRPIPDVGKDLENGKYCGQDHSVCLSNNCVNFRCCNTRCTDNCKRCDVKGHLGECTVAPGTPCADEECLPDGNVSIYRTCSASGTCSTEVKETDCGNHICDGATGRCMETCSETKGCVSGTACFDGRECFAENGQPCSQAGECLSMICSKDGVCCDAACDGFCESCKIKGSAGKCIKVPAGQDPDNECEKDEASTCKQDGFCDGAGSCGLYGKETVCQGTTTCDGTASVKGYRCDGQGSCQEMVTSCSPFLCNTSEDACYTSCSGTGEGQCPGLFACASNNTCYTDCTMMNAQTNCRSGKCNPYPTPRCY